MALGCIDYTANIAISSVLSGCYLDVLWDSIDYKLSVIMKLKFFGIYRLFYGFVLILYLNRKFLFHV